VANLSVGVDLNIGNGCTFSTGNFTLGVTGTITCDGIFTPNPSTIISSSALTGTGTIKVTRTSATADFLTQYNITSKTIANLTVDYVAAAAQQINALTYGGLKISNTSGGLSISGSGNNVVVNGMFIRTSGTLSIGTNTLTLNGGITNTAGTLSGGANSNLVIGANSNLISVIGNSATSLSLNNLTLNGGTTNLNCPVTVAGTLSLSGGIITTDVTNILSVTNTLTTAVGGSPSASSFVKGPLKWSLLASQTAANHSNYLFPLGDGNGVYRPIVLVDVVTGAAPIVTVTALSSGAATFTAPILDLYVANWSITASGTFTNSLVKIIQNNLVSTDRIIFSAAQSGSYVDKGATFGAGNADITSTTATGVGYIAIGSTVAFIRGTLYLEDFSNSLNNGKGQNGVTYDMTGVTNWTVDLANSVTMAAGDEFMQTSGGLFESFNTDAISQSQACWWYSTLINICGYTDVSLFVDLSRVSNASGFLE
jgi:hypothetical protein